MALLAQQQFSIRRLVDGKTLNFFLTANHPTTQVYTPDPATYLPNYGTNNLVITPSLMVSGTGNDQIGQLKSAPTWKINGTVITGTNATYGATGATSAPYALTITKNLIADSYLKIECSAIYVQPVSLLETSVSSTITVTKTSNNGASILATINAANGNIFRNNLVASLPLSCDMVRGATIDSSDVEYQWAINQSGSWTNLTSANQSTYGVSGLVAAAASNKQITITPSSVLNVASFRCTCKDNDASSSTYNQTVYDVITVTDLSDPFEIKIDLAKGDGIGPGGSVSAKIDVYQGSAKQADSWFAGKTCRFFRYSAAGVLDSSWGTAGYKTPDATRSITITEADLLANAFQTTFGADVNG